MEILIIFGYLVVAGATINYLETHLNRKGVTNEQNTDRARLGGFCWPITIPLLIGMKLMAAWKAAGE